MDETQKRANSSRSASKVKVTKEDYHTKETEKEDVTFREQNNTSDKKSSPNNIKQNNINQGPTRK